MADYEDERHVEKTTSTPASRLVHRESVAPKAKSRVEKRTGIVLSCSNRRGADRRKNYDEDASEKGHRQRKRRQRTQGLPQHADQILVIALKGENLAASHLKAGDKVYVEPVFNLEHPGSAEPPPAPTVVKSSEQQKAPEEDCDYIVHLSGKPPKPK